ncbi:MAG TPA: serine/threonine-protein kinase [Polyangiaceae bacterium]|nr:serine/threonine-protein kinase [Polyangiaceae bacterium]
MSLSTGDVIDGKYRIVRLIGEGGMGAVYEGENIRIHRTVAIKVLHAGVAENQDAVQRFEREAQAAGRIGSEHIVEVLDLGNLPDGDRFMVMEYMDGDSLSARIQKRTRLTAQETYPIARQILEGLAAAHGAGIIHRDLKPDNVFLLKRRGGHADFVKLLDFGISKFSALSGESGFSMTRTGAVMGTPYYMSPEQAKGAKGMDHRADLYAVGVILYECVTGRVPFNADTFNELLFKIVLETPQPIEQVIPDSDPAFNQIIQHAMAREPQDRYQTAREFQEAIDAWASGSGVTAPTAFNATPNLTAQQTAQVLNATPAGGTPPLTTPDPGRQTGGAPGTWANTGSGAAVQAAAVKKPSFALVGGIAVGAVVLGAVGFGALRQSPAAPEPAASAVAAAAPSAPSLDQIRAAAQAEAEAQAQADEAQRVAAAQKEADEKVRKAEEEAHAAEQRANQATSSAQVQAEVTTARERVKAAKAAAAAVPKQQAAASKPESPPTAPAATATQQSGRKIRTEL